MLNGKEFVESIIAGNQPLFEASRINVRAYFNANPSKEELLTHFVGRMVNERINMVELSKQVSEMSHDTDPAELEKLSRQAYDEAVHFRLVKEVVEKLNSGPVDISAEIKAEEARPTAKGALLLEKYDAQDNPIALAVYQLVSEGRAAAVWDEMAKCIDDEFIASRYTKIAKDEEFHSTIGSDKLEVLAVTAEAQVEAMLIINGMREDLFDINCENTKCEPSALTIVNDAYGWNK